jgi:hypothetical protein
VVVAGLQQRRAGAVQLIHAFHRGQF